MVFLSACFTEGLADSFLKAGAEHVVCIKKEDSVLDEACVKFSKTFYEQIKERKCVCDAFNIALQMISISKGLETQVGLFVLKI